MKKFYYSSKKGNRSPFNITKRIGLLGVAALFLAFIMTPSSMEAIPSFARQTGLSCAACHTVFPELNSFGRQFKLNGYTMTNIKTIDGKNKTKNGKEKTNLKLLSVSNLSFMFKTGFTHIAKTLPGTQNNDVEFPQATSLYYGGQITPHMGSFIQFTMDNSGTFGLDMVDIRYSNTTQIGKSPFLYGFALDNGPMMEDVWNTASPWSYPYSGSGAVPSPTAGTMIEGGMMGTLGAGAYSLINNLLYVGFSLYRTAPLGAALPPDNTSMMTIKGVSPYWRIALQKQWSKDYLEVGTFGLSTEMYPMGVSGATDNYTDAGFDLQYEHYYNFGQFTLHCSYTNENQNLNATYASSGSQFQKNKINSFKTDASISLRKGCKFTLGYFDYTGSSDQGIYAPAAVTGSRTGSPNSNGLMAQIDYLPWKNTKFSFIYTAYNKFNGASDNYDGFDRNASDNNSVYLQMWFLF